MLGELCTRNSVGPTFCWANIVGPTCWPNMLAANKTMYTALLLLLLGTENIWEPSSFLNPPYSNFSSTVIFLTSLD